MSLVWYLSCSLSFCFVHELFVFFVFFVSFSFYILGALSPTPIVDIIIYMIERKEREGEREYELEYGAPAVTTNNIILKFCEKEREGGFDKGGVAPIPQQGILDLLGYFFGGLFGFLFDICAPLFGAYSQAVIGLYGGLLAGLSTAFLSTVIGLFGGLNGYAIAPHTGAHTKHNDNFIGNDNETPTTGVTVTICNGFINGLSCPRAGGTIITIIG